MADDTGAQSDQDDPNKPGGTNDTSGANADASGAAGTQDTDTSGDGANKDGDKVVTQADLDAALNRMKAADKRAADLQAKLDEAARKEKSDLENATADLKKSEERIVELERKLDETALTNAFLSNNKYSWHDSSDALRLLDREGVEVKDGEVSGLLPAIEKLAKAKPHLLKEQGKDGSGDGKNGSSGASGTPKNGQRKGDGSSAPADYSGRFPALRTRAKVDHKK